MYVVKQIITRLQPLPCMYVHKAGKSSMAMGNVKYMGVTFPTRPKDQINIFILAYGIYNADHEYYD